MSRDLGLQYSCVLSEKISEVRGTWLWDSFGNRFLLGDVFPVSFSGGCRPSENDSGFTVIFDVNVLYPSMLRDILIRLAGPTVLDEVFRNLQDNRPDLDPDKLHKTRELMCKAIDDCLVTGYEELIESLALPDPDDRHVLAAAIRCGAQGIVTENKKDFPKDVIDRYGIEMQGADEFLCDQIDLFGPRVHQAVTYAAAAFKKPPRTIDGVLDALSRSGAPSAAGLLRR